MNNFLYLDPTEGNKLILVLFKKDKVYSEEIIYQKPLSEIFLVEVDKLLSKTKTKLGDLEALVLIKGPGAFSSLRTAVSLVNTISWAMNIPSIAFKKGELKSDQDMVKQISRRATNKKFKTIIPFYGREPNITKSKK